jgi:hypothetical protein
LPNVVAAADSLLVVNRRCFEYLELRGVVDWRARVFLEELKVSFVLLEEGAELIGVVLSFDRGQQGWQA